MLAVAARAAAILLLSVVSTTDGSSGGGGGGGSTPPPCALAQRTSTVSATHDGQVIEGLSVAVSNGSAISVHGFKRVTIRNVELTFGPHAQGIEFSAADGITIVNASLRLVGAPTAAGALPSASAVAIGGSDSADVRIERVRAEGCSAGVYLLQCPGARLSEIEAHNMRGPMPRGQCVQMDKCNSSVLSDFSCENDNSSYTEDNINIFESTNVTVRRGLIDGNNSPSGDGVMFECGDKAHAFMTSGLVEDVDAIHQGNGCFGGWGVSGLEFRNCRVMSTHCVGWAGRAKPSSGALVFAGGTEGGANGQPSSGLRIVNGSYHDLCKQNLVWPGSAFVQTELVDSGAFEPRPPLRLEFCWVRAA
jgi:hypothetical protein